MAYLLLVVAGAISVLFAAGIFYLTLKPCKTSGISYLVGVPASFSLLTLSFIMNLCTTVLNSTQLLAGPILNVLYLLLETYGFLFLALTYARNLGEVNRQIFLNGTRHRTHVANTHHDCGHFPGVRL